MQDSRYEIEIPPDRIAYYPAKEREESRLMQVDRAARSVADAGLFRDVGALFAPGDLVVMNDTLVRKARLHGSRKTGGAVEALLLEFDGARVKALVRPLSKLKLGEEIIFGAYSARLVEKTDAGPGVLDFGDEDPMEVADEIGCMPLPPYIKRAPEESDERRYQTVVAARGASAAAPTAGLHFSRALISELEARGVVFSPMTLDVSYATFSPVRPDQTRLHMERYSIPEETMRLIRERRSGQTRGRVVAVGTTVVRALESSAVSGLLSGETDIFIRPGFQFTMIDAMITNFHLPGSSLLMLVHAFAGDVIFDAYRRAIDSHYRFYSYGDCMIIM